MLHPIHNNAASLHAQHCSPSPRESRTVSKSYLRVSGAATGGAVASSAHHPPAKRAPSQGRIQVPDITVESTLSSSWLRMRRGQETRWLVLRTPTAKCEGIPRIVALASVRARTQQGSDARTMEIKHLCQAAYPTLPDAVWNCMQLEA
jgi:hypothetical protein